MSALDASPRTADRHPLAYLQTTLPPFTRRRVTVLDWLLRLATAGAFIGHGAYGAFMEKPGWYPFFDALGISSGTVDRHSLMVWVGGFEMLLGVLSLVLPVPAFLLFLFVWKISSEFIWYPLAHKPGWEFVERWSNYTAPLALIIVRGWPGTVGDWFRLHTRRGRAPQ